MNILHKLGSSVGEINLAAGTAVGGTGYVVTDETMQKTIIFYLTAAFLLGQIVLLTPKYLVWYRDWRKRRRAKRDAEVAAMDARLTDKLFGE